MTTYNVIAPQTDYSYLTKRYHWVFNLL